MQISNKKYPTLISIQGITASGKSEMAINLAKNIQKNGFSVWIINADSRQVYKSLDIGTAKIPGVWETRNNLEAFYFQDIPHFLIDYVNLDQDYGLVNFIEDFEKLTKRVDAPDYFILVGGSGLYSKAILTGEKPLQVLPEFQKEFDKLKLQLQELSLFKLQAKISPEEKPNINYSDFNNTRRLISRILNSTSIRKNWIEKNENETKVSFDKVYQFGVKIDNQIWEDKIKKRVQKWTENDDNSNPLIQETKKLETLGPSKIQQLGFEYSTTWDCINGKFNKQEWQKRLFQANRKYAKKQKTWLNKQPNVVWIEGSEDILKILSS
jgi:tRNA dimethylallyltransferase